MISIGFRLVKEKLTQQKFPFNCDQIVCLKITLSLTDKVTFKIPDEEVTQKNFDLTLTSDDFDNDFVISNFTTIITIN